MQSLQSCQSAAIGKKVLHESRNSLQSAPWPDVYNNTFEIYLMPETIIPWKLFLMSGLEFFLMFGPVWGGRNSSPGITANIESNLMACNFPNISKNCSSCELTCCFPSYVCTSACSCETSLTPCPVLTGHPWGQCKGALRLQWEPSRASRWKGGSWSLST